MSGHPWFGSDIGGYREGLPTEEVLLRWMAFGVFNPVMQIGGGGASHMPWTADSTYSPAALDITRELLKLRMVLFPHIFQRLKKSRHTGRPLVQSLWMAFPTEPEARRRERDFLFGPDLLVAPVFTPNTTAREVLLPPGQWVEIWPGERLEGGQVLTRPIPIDRIPVFLRAGAILALAPEGVHTLLPASAPGVTGYQDMPGCRVLPGQPMGVDYASHQEPPVPLAQGDPRTCMSCWAISPTSGRLIVRVPHDGTLTLY